MGLTPPTMQRVPSARLHPGLVAYSLEFYRIHLRNLTWREFVKERGEQSPKFGLLKSQWNPVWNEVFDERTLLRPAQGVHEGRTELLRAAEGVSASDEDLLRAAE